MFSLRQSLLSALLVLTLLSILYAKDSATADEYYERGKAALTAKKYPDAVKNFKDALKRSHNQCEACYVGLAVAHWRMGSGKDALENCEKALALAANDHERSDNHYLKGNVLMWMGAKDPGKLTQAEAEYRAAINLDPSRPAPHFNLGYVLLRQNQDEAGAKELQLYLNMSPNGATVAQAERFLANPRTARENLAPDFDITTLQGENLSLRELSGKIVVLDFWATWCHACRAALPEIKDLVKKYPPERLVVISVSVDSDQQAWRNFITEKKMEWPQYLDTSHQMTSSFAVRAFPTYCVIDGAGVIRERIVGTDPQESIAHKLKDKLKVMSELQAK